MANRALIKEIKNFYKHVKNNRKIVLFLKSNPNIDFNFKALSFICYVHAKNNEINPVDLFKKIDEQKILDTYLNSISNEAFILEIKNNYQNLNFWKEKLHKTIENYLLNFNNMLQSIFINNSSSYTTASYNLTYLSLMFFIINEQIEQFDQNSKNNLINFDKYNEQINQFSYNLEIINKIQKVLMELSSIKFGDNSVALNILSKRLY